MQQTFGRLVRLRAMGHAVDQPAAGATAAPCAQAAGQRRHAGTAGRALANGFDDPRTFFPWFADAGEADYYIDSCAAIAAMAAVPA